MGGVDGWVPSPLICESHMSYRKAKSSLTTPYQALVLRVLEVTALMLGKLNQASL